MPFLGRDRSQWLSSSSNHTAGCNFQMEHPRGGCVEILMPMYDHIFCDAANHSTAIKSIECADDDAAMTYAQRAIRFRTEVRAVDIWQGRRYVRRVEINASSSRTPRHTAQPSRQRTSSLLPPIICGRLGW